MEIVSGGVSDVGRIRTNNEDSYKILDSLSLYVLSDGMGGEAHGEVASALAVETVVKCCTEAKEDSGVTLLVIDEAARVPDALYFSVRPMLAVSRGRLVALSTPFELASALSMSPSP